MRGSLGGDPGMGVVGLAGSCLKWELGRAGEEVMVAAAAGVLVATGGGWLIAEWISTRSSSASTYSQLYCTK